MKSFKVYVEVGHYIGGYDQNGPKGSWTRLSSDCFETIVQARNYNQAQTIAQAQFGGPANCKVWVRGEV